MIIDLRLSFGRQRIRTRSTPAVRHAVDLIRAVLALSQAGAITVRSSRKPPPLTELDRHLRPLEAVWEVLRWGTNVQTEAGLSELHREVRRDASLAARYRREIVARAAPLLADCSATGTSSDPASDRSQIRERLRECRRLAKRCERGMERHIQLAERESDINRSTVFEEVVTAYEQAAEACQMAIEQFEAGDIASGDMNLATARAMHEKAKRRWRQCRWNNTTARS